MIRAALTALVFVELPLLAVGYTIALALRPLHMADFRVFLGAAHDVLSGSAGSFVYPPPSALAVVPLSVLPYTLAAVIWLIVIGGAVPLTLWALGVRDWRCYTLAIAAPPTLAVLGSGSLSSLLALGAALAWRYRDDRRVAAPLLALVVVAKIFLWPLVLWLVATRRYAVSAATIVWGVVIAVGSWAVIGFAGLTEYPHLLRNLAGLEQTKGYAPVSLYLALGLPSGAARALATATGLALVAGAFVAARRADGDRRSFVLAVAASLALTPVCWLHYYVLLLLPIALTTRRLGSPWLVLLGFFAVSMGSDGDLVRILAATALTATVFGLGLRGEAGARSSPSALVPRTAVAEP